MSIDYEGGVAAVNTYTVTVVIECETAEQANQVIAERIYYDEDYGFPYTINVLSDLKEECGTCE